MCTKVLTDACVLLVDARKVLKWKVWVKGFSTHILLCIWDNNSRRNPNLKFSKRLSSSNTPPHPWVYLEHSAIELWGVLWVFALLWRLVENYLMIQYPQCGYVKVTSRSYLSSALRITCFWRMVAALWSLAEKVPFPPECPPKKNTPFKQVW